MKKICIVCVALALHLMAQMPTSKDDQAKQILALENAWNPAEIRGDTGGLDLLLGADFVYTDSDGSVKQREKWLAGVKDDASQLDLLGNQDEIVHMYGDAAIVTGEYYEKIRTKGKPVRRRGRFTDTWVKQNGQWKCVASQVTLVSP